MKTHTRQMRERLLRESFFLLSSSLFLGIVLLGNAGLQPVMAASLSPWGHVLRPFTAPEAVSDSYTTSEDTSANITANLGLLINDSDPDGDPLTALLITGPEHGALASFNPDGSFIYEPGSNYFGQDTLTYAATDGVETSSPANVSLTIQSVNDAPTAGSDQYALEAGTTLNVTALMGVLSNDQDIEGDALSAALATNPSHGSVTLNLNGSFTYTPQAGFSGLDSFTYTASDGSASSSPAPVNLTIFAANAAPLAADDAYSGIEDTVLNRNAAQGVLANDIDADGDLLTAALVAGPTHGSLNLNPDGSFSYSPDTNFNGVDSFTYTASDGAETSAIATVSLDMASVNDAPIANSNTYNATEDQPLSVSSPGVLGNDVDPDGDSLIAILTSNPSHGTLSMNANGGFTFTPTANYSGPDGFTYAASDGSASSSPATVSLVINAVNDDPVANNDNYNATEDQPLTINAPGVLANDTDADGDPLAAILANGPSHGTLALNTNGSFTYTPASNYAGPDSFTYTASDGVASSSPATVSISVSPTNDGPVANNDAYATPEDEVLTVSAPGVLGNDTDPDGDALTAAIASGTTHGTLTLNANGSFTYTPAAGYNGPDSFTYTASDGSASSLPATVALTVNAVNDPPIASNDSYNTGKNETLIVNPPGVLGNDTDPEGSSLSAVLVTAPSHGTLSLNPNGGFSYTPTNNYSGADSFTYRATDGAAQSSPASVSINIINHAPSIIELSNNTVNENQPAGATVGNFTTTDPDSGDSHTYSFVGSGNDNGLFSISGSTLKTAASFDFEADSSYTIRVRSTDLDGLWVEQQFTILILGVNEKPLAAGDEYSLNEDTPLSVPAPGVLANDTDPEGDTLQASLVSGVSHGTLNLQPNGSFTYTPAANYSGEDSFTYKASDGTLQSAPVLVLLTISPAPDAPQAQADSYSTPEDTPRVVAAPGVLANDTDADGDSLTAQLVQTVQHGTLSFQTNGSFTYTPNANFHGTDRFTYQANDGLQNSAVVAVTLTVSSVNDLPQANDDSKTTPEDTPVEINVLENDTDPDGHSDLKPASVKVITAPTHGSTSVNSSTGAITYTPNPNYTGPDTFEYEVCDTANACDRANVQIVVGGANDAPVAQDDSFSVVEDTPTELDVLVNDTDADGAADFDLASVKVTTVPQFGQVVANMDGSLTFTPKANFHGADSLVYEVCDLGGACDAASVTLTITPVNDAPNGLEDVFVIQQGQPLTVTQPGVLENDVDVDGDVLQAIQVTAPMSGTLAFQADGSFIYTPAADFFGFDSFTYSVSDGQVSSDPIQVNITIQDSLPPTVTWDLPVQTEGIYYVNVNAGPVTLTVTAMDNLAVTSVRFYRWDAANSVFVDIARVTAAPFTCQVDPADLEFGWNQVYVQAFDPTGNRSERQRILIYVRQDQQQANGLLYLPVVTR